MLYLYRLKNYIQILWAKTLIYLGHKFPADVIPEGLYCYTPDDERNELIDTFSDYYIIPCPYYKNLGKKTNGCSYFGCITDDFVFNDQCKMCSENLGIY